MIVFELSSYGKPLKNVLTVRTKLSSTNLDTTGSAKRSSRIAVFTREGREGEGATDNVAVPLLKGGMKEISRMVHTVD